MSARIAHAVASLRLACEVSDIAITKEQLAEMVASPSATSLSHPDANVAATAAELAEALSECVSGEVAKIVTEARAEDYSAGEWAIGHTEKQLMDMIDECESTVDIKSAEAYVGQLLQKINKEAAKSPGRRGAEGAAKGAAGGLLLGAIYGAALAGLTGAGIGAASGGAAGALLGGISGLLTADSTFVSARVKLMRVMAALKVREREIAKDGKKKKA